MFNLVASHDDRLLSYSGGMAPRAYSSERRAASAAVTRSDVLRSALQLFSESGYNAVTMPQIAAHARVSIATVYAAVGGKPQLLIALLTDATEDVVIDAAMQAVADAATPREVIQAIARGSRLVSERHRWLLTTLYDNAGADPLIAERVVAANEDQRSRFGQAARRIQVLGGADGQSVDQATTVLLFYFGVPPWRALRDAAWSWDQAEQWLILQAQRALGS